MERGRPTGARFPGKKRWQYCITFLGINSFRANATIPIFRCRFDPPQNRSSYHRLNSLRFCQCRQPHPSSIINARIRGFPALLIP
jgi:hypothetical protein